jgi:31-O-methyltransferase
MGSSLKDRVLGKWYAVGSLAQFVRYFRNWREVWDAYRTNAPLPPMVLSNGLTLHHDPADDPILLFRELFVHRCYTRDGFYRPRRGDVVLDVGGNIGFFAVSLEWMTPGVRVYSFEPAADTRGRLQHNVTANNLGGLVTVYPFAVTNAPGEVRLNGASLTGHRSLFDRESGANAQGEAVRSINLAQAIELTEVSQIDLLKVDVEGSEVEIVEGADAATWRKIRRVVVEYHDLFRPGCRERVTRVLAAQGFPFLETLPESDPPGLGLIRASRER